jgi:hypothetical protein
VPLDHFLLRDYEAVEIFMALMATDAQGRPVISAQTESFLSAQMWREFKGDLEQRAGSPAVGVLGRDDDGLYALSALPAPLPAGGEEPAPLGEEGAQNILMVSSLSLVDGLPVLLGVSSAGSALAAEDLQSLCRVVTLFLRLSNKQPGAGFFNPDPDKLVIAGRKVHVALPADGCLLKAGHPRETMTLILLQENLRGIHFYPLLAYAPCEVLDNWRQSRQLSGLSDYGLLGVIQRNGQLQAADDVDSAEFLQRLKDGQADAPLAPALLDSRDWRETVSLMPPSSLEEVGHFGVDNYAGYWAVLVRPPGQNAQAGGVLAGIMAVGMVNGLELTGIRYRPLESKNVFTELLAQQKAMFRKLSGR